MAIITPSRHMETLMLAIVRNVRRRLRQQFFNTRGRNRNMRAFLVYEFPRPVVGPIGGADWWGGPLGGTPGPRIGVKLRTGGPDSWWVSSQLSALSNPSASGRVIPG